MSTRVSNSFSNRSEASAGTTTSSAIDTLQRISLLSSRDWLKTQAPFSLMLLKAIPVLDDHFSCVFHSKSSDVSRSRQFLKRRTCVDNQCMHFQEPFLCLILHVHKGQAKRLSKKKRFSSQKHPCEEGRTLNEDFADLFCVEFFFTKLGEKSSCQTL